MTLWSRHKFVPDEENPKLCAHCSRQADVHKVEDETLPQWQSRVGWTIT